MVKYFLLDLFGRRLQIDPMSLENQVSNLLVNHLAKTSNSGNCALGYEVLQVIGNFMSIRSIIA